MKPNSNIVNKNSKNVFQFDVHHPLYKTHGAKYIDKNELRVPNFLGATLPRSDKGDREYYSCTMLTLFKPWRKGSDLKSTRDCSWDDAYNAYDFAESDVLLMKNFNIRYECMDERDDYRAQLKKGSVPDIFNSWEPTSGEGVELPASTFQPDASDILNETNEDALIPGYLHRRKLQELESIRSIFNLSGWTSPCDISAGDYVSIQPTSIASGAIWEGVVNKHKQDVLTQKNEHNLASSSQKEKQNECEGSFVPNIVKIVDKSYLYRSYELAGQSEHVSNTIAKFSLNTEQERAFRIIANHAISPNSDQLKMYLGGMGGTGKSQVLKALGHFFRERNEAHRFVVVAPTGTAAALLGGSTYHSMFGINERMSNNKIGVIKARLTGVDYVFFDEVSMLSARDLYRINNQLAKVMGVADKPFGGLNMVFSGDFAQLPPAIGGEKVSLYSRVIGAIASDRKSQEEAIGKALWHQITTVVILRKNMRQCTQSTEDAQLRTALENMRYKACTSEDICFLRTRISSAVPGRASICDKDFRNVSIITGTNLHKDEINRLGSIRFAQETEQTLTKFFSEDSEKANPKEGDKSRGISYMKQISDDIQAALWGQPPSSTDKHIAGKLSLCVGMPVMIRYNYATELCMTRGQEGYIVGWQGKKGLRGQDVLDVLFVELKEPPSSVKIDGLPANVVPLYPTVNTIQVTLPSGSKYYVQRKQIEVLPNFAMTDFASQGKTRKYNVADLYNLSSHQAYYTALSRSASAAGTLIVQGFDARKITGGCSGALRQEFRELEVLDAITALIHDEKLPTKVCGVTRNELIHTFRQWKGQHFVPRTVHSAIRWSKRNPFEESVIFNPALASGQINGVGVQSIDQVVGVDASIASLKRKLSVSNCATSDDTHNSAKRMRSTSEKSVSDSNYAVCDLIPKGFVWQNNSCAYDSVFAVLLQLWRADVHYWNRVSHHIGNEYLTALFTGFHNTTTGSTSLESVRDTVRHMLHVHSPSYMRFGCYTSIDSLFSAMLVSRYPVSRSYYTCTNGHQQVAHVLHTLHQSVYVSEYKTTSEWLSSQSVANATARSRSCSTCEEQLLLKHVYIEPPPLIALEWNGLDIYINSSVSIDVDGTRKEYCLKGVIYFGDGHFTSVVALEDGQLWFYDGMEHRGAMQYIGNLHVNAPDLHSQGGKVAVAGIYTLSNST